MSQGRIASNSAAVSKRNAIAQRRIGEGVACECGERRPLALVRKGQSVMCAGCIRERKGHTPMDRHHVAAKANHGARIQIPVNDHRAILSAAQHNWPKETLENPHNSPLRRGAACIRGFIDMLHYMIDSFLIWIPEMLESLDEFLTEALHCVTWWIGTPIERFA